MIEDEKIIEMFFRRSEQAIQELDNKYGKVCHKLSYNIVNDRQDAEECVNDAYLGAWNAIPPTKPNPLQAYICKIVRNISLKLYYRKGAAKRNSTYEIAMQELEPYLAAPDTIEAEIETKELAQIIESFLDTLSEENCVIFVRRYWFSDTYAEIAKCVGLSEKNVSVRLTRIRQHLKEYLIEREVFVWEEMSEREIDGNKCYSFELRFSDDEQKNGEMAGRLSGIYAVSNNGTKFYQYNMADDTWEQIDIVSSFVADVAPMVYVNDTLYKQSVTQTSYAELDKEFVYLGEIESEVINDQSISDGIPNKNFQANHSIVGSKVYQYGDNIAVEINGKYWLYENYTDERTKP